MSEVSKDGTVRVGIVGLGMAGSIMIPSIMAHSETALGGAAEVNALLRDKFSSDYDCPAESSIEALVARDDIDAVYIGTPHQFHRDHAILAAENGKHIVVEKPMALTLSDCDAMIEAARANGIQLIVGHTHGFDAPVRKMKEVIDSGRIGRLRMILMFNFTDFLYRPRRPEELDTSRGGGILFNQLPHQIDMVRTLAGDELRSVLAVTGRFDVERNTEGAVMAMLNFADGTCASLTYSGYDRFDSDEFHGWIGEGGQSKAPAHDRTRQANQAMRSSGIEAEMRSTLYGYGGAISKHFKEVATAGHPHFGILIASCEGGDIRHGPEGLIIYGQGGAEVVALDPPRTGGGRSEVLDELCDAILRKIPPQHDGAFGRATLEAGLAILQSSQENREVIIN